jgi:uncharacterized PurR-regulated membrane protein YhhQ (DUF165 family)
MTLFLQIIVQSHKKTGFIMCLIVTIIMFGFAIQSFIQEQYSTGATQLIIALGFLKAVVPLVAVHPTGSINYLKKRSNGTFFYLPLLLGTHLYDT